MAWSLHTHTPVVAAAEPTVASPVRSDGRITGVPPSFVPVSLLGEGGTANVYRARWLPTGRMVALKVSHAQASPRMLACMRTEALIGERLHHAGFARVHAFGRFFDRLWMAQEVIDGVDLPCLIPSPSLTVPRRLSILARVARHLEHLHGQGWVHRDVKGGNILLSRRGPVLIDLGIAAHPGVPQKGNLLCTPRCVPPEQVLGEPFDHRADIFQLGVLAYELFCTEFPWTAEAPLATALAVCSEPARPFRAVLREDLAPSRVVARGLERIVKACLQQDPAKRPAHASDVADALDALMAS